MISPMTGTLSPDAGTTLTHSHWDSGFNSGDLLSPDSYRLTLPFPHSAYHAQTPSAHQHTCHISQ